MLLQREAYWFPRIEYGYVWGARMGTRTDPSGSPFASKVANKYSQFHYESFRNGLVVDIVLKSLTFIALLWQASKLWYFSQFLRSFSIPCSRKQVAVDGTKLASPLVII